MNTLAVIARLADKLAADMPRNLDIAHLRFLVGTLKTAQPPPLKKRDWAGIKRRQRARRRETAPE